LLWCEIMARARAHALAGSVMAVRVSPGLIGTDVDFS
jgi:hypothetical protein